MADSYLASNEFPGDGVTTLWNVSFKGNRPDAGSGVVPYLNAADVKAQVITPATATEAEVVVDVAIVYVGPNQFRVTPATPVGKITRIYRSTQDEYALVDYQSLQTVGEADLDLSNKQLVFITQESRDLAIRASSDAANAADVAYNAIATANDAEDIANAALSVANTAIATANTALGIADDADNKADQAIADAASAEAHATAADVAAAAAQVAANAAQSQATAANAAAANAVTVANGIDGKATTALANSITANDTANDALDTANGIDAKATTALTNANTALVAANDAVDTADAVDAKATTALSDSATALSAANSAVSTANSAVTTANTKAAKGANSDITSLSGLTTALSIAQGGTGNTAGLAAAATKLNTARTINGVAFDGTANITAGYYTGNIVGTVSHSSGVPTGAIIERGSNANGVYVKYADGTMVVWKVISDNLSVSTAYGAMFASASLGLGTMAATFARVDNFSVSPMGADGATIIGYGAVPTSLSVFPNIVLLNPVSGFKALSLYIRAEGVWHT